MALARSGPTGPGRSIPETPLFGGLRGPGRLLVHPDPRSPATSSWATTSRVRESPWPFFPLLPGILRVGSWLGPSEALVGVLVNHCVFLLGLAGLYRLTRRHFDGPALRLALVWAIALFPASIMFSMVYPSAILFAGSVWAFDFVEDRREHRRGPHHRGGGHGAPERLPHGHRAPVYFRRVEPAPRAITCGLAAHPVGAWCLYNLDRTGDASTLPQSTDRLAGDRHRRLRCCATRRS